MFRKLLLGALAVSAMLCLTVPAAAETFTSQDGIMSIELPNENWKEVTDPNVWIVLSDGGNVITVDHLSNGEKTPDMTVADSHYVNVYQAVFSTQNEIFIITGSVLDASKIPEVCNAIMSAKVLKYDTKMAIAKEAAPVKAQDFTIAPMNATMYATAGVNVRSGCSTSDAILGAVEAGGAVTVTGTVQYNGEDYGWYQVNYNGQTGYISAAFLSDTAPAAASNNTAKTGSFTGVVKVIYAADGTPVTIYQSNDGYDSWYDVNGNHYYQTTNYQFYSDTLVKSYSINKPMTGSDSSYPLTDGFGAFWGNGNGTTLVPYSDGYYYSSEWVRYTDNGDGSYSGADGTTLYDYDPISGTPDDALEADTRNYSHKLLSQETGAAVIVQAYSATDHEWFDSKGTAYQDNGDGTFTDFYGNDYDVLW